MSDLSFEGDVDAAREFVIDTQYASIQQIQRRRRVGPNRAQSIMNALEQQRVVERVGVTTYKVLMPRPHNNGKE